MTSIIFVVSYKILYIYSSKECQINDWRIHKQNCQKMDNKKYSVNDGSIFTESKPKGNAVLMDYKSIVTFKGNIAIWSHKTGGH